MKTIIKRILLISIISLFFLFTYSCKNNNNKEENKEIDISHIKYHEVEGRIVSSFDEVGRENRHTGYGLDLSFNYYKNHSFKIREEYGIDFDTSNNTFKPNDNYIKTAFNEIKTRNLNDTYGGVGGYYNVLSLSNRISAEELPNFGIEILPYLYSDTKKNDIVKTIAFHEIIECDEDKIVGYNLFILYSYFLTNIYSVPVIELMFDYDDKFTNISLDELDALSNQFKKSIKFYHADYEIIADGKIKQHLNISTSADLSLFPYEYVAEEKVLCISSDIPIIISEGIINNWFVGKNIYTVNKINVNNDGSYLYKTNLDYSFIKEKTSIYIISSELNSKLIEFSEKEPIYFYYLIPNEILPIDVQMKIIDIFISSGISFRFENDVRYYRTTCPKLLLKTDDGYVLIPSITSRPLVDDTNKTIEINNIEYNISMYSLNSIYYYNCLTESLMSVLEAYNKSLLTSDQMENMINNFIHYYD